MKVVEQLPKSKPMLKKISEVLPDLFDGESLLSADEINEMLNGGIFTAEQIEQMRGFNLLESENLEIKDEPKQGEKPEKPEIEKVETTKLTGEERNPMKFSIEGFTFNKIPNTSKTGLNVSSLFSKDEAIQNFNDRGLEGKEPNSPTIQVVVSTESAFGGMKALFAGTGIQNRKGNETLFIVNQPISQTEYLQYSNKPFPNIELKIDEYTISKGSEKLETLKFPINLHGDTKETAYKCFIVVNGKERDIYVLSENEDGNGFNISGRLFANVYKFN